MLAALIYGNCATATALVWGVLLLFLLASFWIWQVTCWVRLVGRGANAARRWSQPDSVPPRQSSRRPLPAPHVVGHSGDATATSQHCLRRSWRHTELWRKMAAKQRTGAVSADKTTTAVYDIYEQLAELCGCRVCVASLADDANTDL